MTRIPRHGVALACAFVAVATLAGQETPAPAPSFTLSEVVARALASDAGIAASQAQRVAAQSGVSGARRWDDPVLAVEGARHDEPEDDPWRLRVALSQRVVLPRARHADVTARQAEAAEVDALIALRQWEVVREVGDLAMTVRAADGRVAALVEEEQAVSRLLSVVRERVGSGQATTSDLLLAQVEGLELQGRVALARHEALAARARLARRVGLSAADVGAIASETDGMIPDLATVIAAAGRHPTVRVAEAVVATRRAARMALDPLVPEWQVGVFAERDGDANEAGIALDLPLPAWNRNRAGRIGASARMHAAIAEVAAARQRAEAEAEAAWYAVEVARVRVEQLDRDVIPVLTEARRLAEADWAAGSRTLDTVLNAQRSLTRLRGEQTDARAAWARAYLALTAAAAVEIP